MKGVIIDYKNNEGIISGEDGKRYNFNVKEIKNSDNKRLLRADVDFSLENEQPTSIYILKEEKKSFPIKLIFSIFLIISGIIITLYGLYLLNDIAFLKAEDKKIINMAFMFKGSSLNEVIIIRAFIAGIGIVLSGIGFLLKIK